MLRGSRNQSKIIVVIYSKLKRVLSCTRFYTNQMDCLIFCILLLSANVPTLMRLPNRAADNAYMIPVYRTHHQH